MVKILILPLRLGERSFEKIKLLQSAVHFYQPSNSSIIAMVLEKPLMIIYRETGAGYEA